jgi:RNA polymerase sigma factor (sigma-70 family)
MEINDDLIRQWEPKVQKMVSNVYVVGLDRDDVAQELRLAIVKAAKGFEEDRGVVFHTYLHTAMTNTIRTLLSKSQRQSPATVSLDAVNLDFMASLPSQSVEILKALTDPSDFTIDVEFKEFVDVCGLDAIEKAFITLRLEGLTMEEITEDLGEPAYKVRQAVRAKLFKGVLNETQNAPWGDDKETVVDSNGRRV